MRPRRVAGLLALLGLLAPISGPAAASEVDKSKNVRLIKRFAYRDANGYSEGGTDIDFQGRYVYVARQGPRGGVQILDASRKVPRTVGFVRCPGTQNDVAIVKPGLLALGYHSSGCGLPGMGVRLIDVRNPRRPRLLGQVETPGGSHTITVYPGKPIIYASPGGLPTNGGATEQIIDVSNPRRPKIVNTFRPNASGCHDLTFDIRKRRKIAVCPGMGETQIWDVTKPTKPATIGHIVNPLMFFHHSAAVSPDGRYLVLGDENFAADECVGGPTGAIYVYDLANLIAPTPVSYFGIARGPALVSSPDIDRGAWCTAHLFNFIPGTRTLVSSWYAGGMNVIDLRNPANPTEIAYYAGGGANYWSAYWYDGRIWANDRVRGLDVFTVKGLKAKK